MAAPSISKTTQSNLFNNHYRFRPTTVEQKRVLPRILKNSSRPATVDDDKLQKSSEKSLSFVIDPDLERKSADESDHVELENDSELNEPNETENQDEEQKLKKFQSGSDFDLDFLDDDKWNTDIEEEGKEQTISAF
ncbi:hypothetical protein BpHYR1_044989 [Brachionus plicatilis]|uniref:Uncharacterized protein n=1 Tax=Brachionus plicatilis TaxID=10195 RepID=A0A3M7RIX4_BRAPC|nr:hypothetical protein BpHYR1_044989 [Brachionus plicatilis]